MITDVPLDWVAALAAAIALRTSQKPTGAVGRDPQCTQRAGGDGATVPVPRHG
jgi:hypothetical protein